MSLEEERREDVFIGARSLSEEIALILPTYDLLLEQIEYIRTAARNQVGKYMSRRENNNTIGIFGARGTGKTSALYTVMEKLGEEEKKNNNIILPIIEPDNFGENTKIMGSIVGLLSDFVDKELDEIRKIDNIREKELLNEYFNNCIYKQNNPLKQKRDELIEYYLYTENEYRTLLTNNFEDSATHIKKSSYLLTSDIKFKEKLISLIDLIVKTREKIKLRKCDKNKDEILIFIFIDDIDLKTTKCKELIDSILQYANHPNLVTVLSGDYEILKESLMLSLVNDEDLRCSNISIESKLNDEMTLFDRKLYLANEYLKKVIPPSRRHNLTAWNMRTIPRFSFNKKTLALQLNKLMGKQDFFNIKVGEEIKSLEYAYQIFDKTPRGIINSYYHIDRIIKKSDKNNKEFRDIKALIETMVISSKYLSSKYDEFFGKCLLWGSDGESTFIEYNKFKEYHSTKEQLQFFIVLEIVRILLPTVKYYKNDYDKTKKQVLRSIYTDPRLEQEENKPFWYLNYIHEVTLAIVGNRGLRDGLMLLEYLTLGRFKDSFADYNSTRYQSNQIDKNINVFIAISKLIQSKEDNSILEGMFIETKHNTRSSLIETIDFLEKMCEIDEEKQRHQKNIDYFLKEVFSEKNMNGEWSEKVYWDNVSIMKILLSNTIKKMQKIDEGEYVNNLNRKDKYFEECKFLEKEMGNNNSPNRGVDLKVKNLIVNISEDIVGIIKNYEPRVTIGNQEKLKTVYLKFQEGYHGQTDTLYKNMKNNIQTYRSEMFGEEGGVCKRYISLYNDLNEFIKNNYVSYGRENAKELLEVIEIESYFKIDKFNEIALVIYKMYNYLNSIRREELIYSEFGEHRKYMKQQIQKAKIKVQLDMSI